MAHNLSFVHESVCKSFCASVLLWYMRGRVVNLNALFL